ncbi:nucleotide-diphospho-sugar transferase [Protomyces lactucae-debilis]|uniref:Nucleotide-diphospho-sugar transferase n=1 Tax=Protomyces lactucae-debilis TaxID=2754530 RepID=A0A1Y2FGK2_PROLT|nr:nucleotide-diphospho-sugar transferase [Protomyces lactucae-debilis]ORY83070.1 nucleotide-diphospho-sugar transferase [Protomyces lactucae-debilis]
MGSTELVRKVFPKKIWQTWKVDPFHFEARDASRAKSWLSMNPHHRYEVLTDTNDVDFVEAAFGPNGLNRPDIVKTYRLLTAKILKADLLRYLVMYAEGGVYADIDVEAIRPIERFIPERYNPDDVDMVIGVEIDNPKYAHHKLLGRKSYGFCQWTFMCKPRLPVILRLVDDVVMKIHKLARDQKCSISDITLDFDDVLAVTGPTAFTDSLLAHMSQKTGSRVTWDPFHKMTESRLVAGVLVLTVEAFAAAQGHSDSGTHQGRAALVRHHYHASGWPSTHPRFLHRLLGSIEACNWDDACIELWDSNARNFETYTPDEQDRLVREKNEADEERRRLEEESAKNEERQAENHRLLEAEIEEHRRAKEEERNRARINAAALQQWEGVVKKVEKLAGED